MRELTKEELNSVNGGILPDTSLCTADFLLVGATLLVFFIGGLWRLRMNPSS